MDMSINKLYNYLVTEFFCALFLCVAFALAGYLNFIPNGWLAGKENVNTAFIINTVVILFDFFAIWIMVKLFYVKIQKCNKMDNYENAAKIYHNWSIIRLIFATVAIVMSVMIYYLTLEDLGIYAAAILIIIEFIYCLPSKEKINSYVNVPKNINS